MHLFEVAKNGIDSDNQNIRSGHTANLAKNRLIFGIFICLDFFLGQNISSFKKIEPRLRFTGSYLKKRV